MPLSWQPLEAIPCLRAMWTFISASRPMAKTVVSAVKPGGQAVRPCLSGFLVFGACPGPRFWGIASNIDNGGCSLEGRWRPAVADTVPVRACKALCQIISMGLAPHPAAACWPNPVKIALLLPWCVPDGAVALARPQAVRLGCFCYPLDPCFLFFPAAKCPTHLK